MLTQLFENRNIIKSAFQGLGMWGGVDLNLLIREKEKDRGGEEGCGVAIPSKGEGGLMGNFRQRGRLGTAAKARQGKG